MGINISNKQLYIFLIVIRITLTKVLVDLSQVDRNTNVLRTSVTWKMFR